MLFRRSVPLPARLYTRRHCPLCERLEADLASLQPEARLTRVDVDTDPALRERFGDWVPVLEVDGTILVRGAWVRSELQRRWRSIARAPRSKEDVSC